MKRFLALLLILFIITAVTSCESLNEKETVANTNEPMESSPTETQSTETKATALDPDKIKMERMHVVKGFFSKTYVYEEEDIISRCHEFLMSLDTTPLSEEEDYRLRYGDGLRFKYIGFQYTDGSWQVFGISVDERYFKIDGKMETDVIQSITKEQVMAIDDLLATLPIDEEHELNPQK